VGEDTAPRRPGRPRDQDAIDRARQLRADGKSDADIAAALGRSRQTVTRWLGPGRRKGRPSADVDTAAVAEARAGGASWREVERLTGASTRTARRRIAGDG
jgi:DNA invertase Pin-like site-specific DNA recombinase